MQKSLEIQPSAVLDEAADDQQLFAKVAWRIIPFLFICYVVSFLDRINIGFAQLQMKHDLGFSDAMYGLRRQRSFMWVMCSAKCPAICCWQNSAHVEPSRESCCFGGLPR